MWNRVVLLVAGVACGWSLVHWASAAAERQLTHLLRWIAGLVVGVGLAAWLGAGSPAAGVLALFVFAGAALVAWAANARQVSRVAAPEPLAAPQRPLEGQQGQAVLLVLLGEPAAYDGPAHWAQRLQQRAQAGGAAPHWFVRPWAYRRTRHAYRAMGDANPQRAAIDGLLSRLKARLPQVDLLEAAWLYTTPSLADTLTRLGERGLKRIVLAPVDAQVPATVLREEATRTRLREIGVQVAVAEPLEAGLWPLLHGDAALDRLLRGEPLPAPTPPDDAGVAALADALARRSAG